MKKNNRILHHIDQTFWNIFNINSKQDNAKIIYIQIRFNIKNNKKCGIGKHMPGPY